jgi:hypothetical protein
MQDLEPKRREVIQSHATPDMANEPFHAIGKRPDHFESLRVRNSQSQPRFVDHRANAAELPRVGPAEREHAKVQTARRGDQDSARRHGVDDF